LSNSNAAAERRAKQTVRNLVYALLVTLLLVIVIILGVPRDDSNRIQRIDYLSEASAASEAIGLQVVAPKIPADWWSNSARLEETAGVSSWYSGFVTEDNQFIGLKQAFESNPSWVALTLERNWYERDLQIAGFTWQVWPELRPTSPPSTMNLAMLVEIGSQAIIIYGTASEADFVQLATAIAPQLELIQQGK
jgi:hypothetical protein